MKTPFHGIVAPYTLRSNIVYFHDWRYVSTGGYGWLGPNGERVPMMGPGEVPAMHYDYYDMPLGIHLKAEPARKSEPVLSAATTGDVTLFAGSLIREDGVYRLWYESWLREDFERGRAGTYNAMRYAESSDAVHWKLPPVGRLKFRGERNHNVVYGAGYMKSTGYHGGSVFRDPSAPRAERYKAFHLGVISKESYASLRPKHRGELDLLNEHAFQRDGELWVLCGAVSPDGFRWRALREPVSLHHSDTHNVCEYDPFLGQYVAYVRTWYFCRRTIGRMASADFRRFPIPEELFWPDAGQAPYDTWYANGKTTMPDAPDYHVMFPMRWSLPTDHFEFHLAASPDNVVWGFVPGGAVCSPGEPGSWDSGVVSPGHGMVELPGNRIGILYCGTPVPHKYPRRPPLGALAWAWWPKGRLVALKAPLEGSFALWPLLFKGRTVHLNFRTTMTGHIQVEALADGKVLPGRSFADCDRLAGDALDQLVTWKGQTDLGHKDGQAVVLRFRMRNADLYSVAFR